MGLPPFMEIEQWDRVGLSVAESAKRLRCIAYVDRACMRLEAGHMIARPEYEVKGALGRFAWQDAEHHNQLRNRCQQLRMSPVAFDKCPDGALRKVMDEALKSSTTFELLVALFRVIKPAQTGAVRAYMDKAQPLVDEPTLHLLRHQLIDRERQIAWGQAAIDELAAELTGEQLREAERWGLYLAHLLECAGGVDGTRERVETEPSFTVERGEFVLPPKSARDGRFRKAVTKFEDMEFEATDQERFRTMLYHRFFEMSPAEGVARIHFLTEGKPWPFYYDTARHLWDEVRHAWFGEAALRRKGENIYEPPNWVGWHDMAAEIFTLEEAYTHLTIAIEKAGMKYPPGKREEWEFCRDVIGDPLMTTFQDFDWADEVVHAGYGQRWVVDGIFGGDVRKAAEKGDETVRRRQEYMERLNGKNPESGFAGGY